LAEEFTNDFQCFLDCLLAPQSSEEWRQGDSLAYIPSTSGTATPAPPHRATQIRVHGKRTERHVSKQSQYPLPGCYGFAPNDGGGILVPLASYGRRLQLQMAVDAMARVR